ncbi:MAG: ABC transporter ATP-binding protein [Elusimicrobia bacterium]|nr:ABC transporter ATP-binding protein [Elusimicrobiota bacterium]
MNLLEIYNLSCGYAGKEIIKNISFSVNEGSFLGILGPNGAGKTTLFRSLTKIIKPIEGKIFFQGKALSDLSAKDLAKEIAVLPQILDVPFSFSIEEFVLLGRHPHLKRLEAPGKKDFDIAQKAMMELNIADLKHRKIRDLSGGERQRVLIAQALAQEPKLLLLDEPVNHLDIKHQIEILDLLRDLNKTGLTVVIILHDLNLASEYCDDLLLLNEGKIHTYGKARDVLKYEILEEVYKTVLLVEKNPLSGKPYILLISKDTRAKGIHKESL